MRLVATVTNVWPNGWYSQNVIWHGQKLSVPFVLNQVTNILKAIPFLPSEELTNHTVKIQVWKLIWPKHVAILDVNSPIFNLHSCTNSWFAFSRPSW